MENQNNVNQLKIIILALVNELPGISPEDLQKLSQDTLFYDYFTVASVLSELEEQKLITALEAKDEIRKDLFGRPALSIYLSEAGQLVLKQLADTVSPQMRRMIRDLSREQGKEDALSAFYQANADGAFTVYLSASENKRDLLKIELSVAEEARARKFCKQWQDSAVEIYRYLLRELNKETEQN